MSSIAPEGASPAAGPAAGETRPPLTLPVFRRGRPLKRWRYVGVFCDELMACAARVRVGPAEQAFWAVYTRDPRAPGGGRLRERTRVLVGRGAVGLSRGHVKVRDDGVLLELELAEDAGIEATCAHGRGEVWTRKQAGVRAHGTLALDGERPRAIEALAVIDDTAGYHARLTEWWWSAGVGASETGVALAWNLVSGVNDPPTGSERAVWIAGAAHETPPVEFAPDLSRVCAGDGSELRFVAEAQRRRRENLLVVSSDYTAPFGTFSGTLPGGIALAHGLGVVEHHRAKW